MAAISAQSTAAVEQSCHTEQILEADRQKIVLDYTIRARASLRRHLEHGLYYTMEGGARNVLERLPLQSLINQFQLQIDKRKADQVYNVSVLDIDLSASEIVDLFDDAEAVSNIFGTSASAKGFLKLKGTSGLYKKCKDLREYVDVV